MEENQSQILIYQNTDGKTTVEVRLQDETVWLSLNQISDLFQKAKSTISEHIKHIYEEEELNEFSTVRKFRPVQKEGSSFRDCLAFDGKLEDSWAKKGSYAKNSLYLCIAAPWIP